MTGKISPIKRSPNQRDFYMGVYIPAMSKALCQAGVPWSEKECHEFLKNYAKEFMEEDDFDPRAPRWQILPSGRKVERPFSTTFLNTKGMEKYLDIGRAFCATECKGIQLPFPNEQQWKDL